MPIATSASIVERLSVAIIGGDFRAYADDRLRGEHYDGRWHNIGNVAQLKALDNKLKARTEK